jgi:very-short-patch-repair endonuclease
MVACAPWGAAGEFAASRHGVLTRSQAADNEVSEKVIRRLLRDRDLTEPTPGVLVVVGSPPTWRQQLYIATLASKGAGDAGFRSAAALHDLDGYRPGPKELLLPSRRRIHVPGVVTHVGPKDFAADFIVVDMIPCTSIARTLCDLGSVDPPARVKVAFESAWRDGCSLVWLRQTAERLHRPGQRGTGVLLRLLDDAELKGKPTESALEIQVERALRGVAGLVRQHSVHDRYGNFVARVDFAIPHLKIAVEAHSRRFHFGDNAERSDAAREAALQAEGWIVRYVTHAQARNRAALRASVQALRRARAA